MSRSPPPRPNQITEILLLITFGLWFFSVLVEDYPTGCELGPVSADQFSLVKFLGSFSLYFFFHLMLLAHLITLLPLTAVSLEVPLFNAMC